MQRDELDVFVQTYQQGRTAFKAGAWAVGADLRSWEHPDRTGADGETLAIDVAWVRRPGATRLLVMNAGTHGAEGFVGSALQSDMLHRMHSGLLPAGEVDILLIHGVNPYGFSHCSRVNEDMIDLNRNFRDFAKTPSEHALAEAIQAITVHSTPTGPDFPRIMEELQRLIDQHGMPAVSDAVQCGQYFAPQGVGYGGAGPAWSNDAMRAIWSEYVDGYDLVCTIDWHTGLGGYGEPILLCFDAPDTPGYERAASWWGAAALQAAAAAYESGTRPSYSGLLITAAQDAARAKGIASVGAVIEFGTFAPMEAFRYLLVDRWLRCLPEDADPAAVAELTRQATNFFYPNEPGWNASVLHTGRALIDRALEGLAA